MPSSRSPSPQLDAFGFGAEIAPDRENKQPTTSSLDFDALLSEPLVLHEDLQDGCGGMLWPAGMLLARYMLKYHPNLAEERVVEIGAGGGLVGLAVAKGCKISQNHKLLITDQIPMLSLMQTNIALNKLGDKVEAVVYDWGTIAPRSVIDPNAATSQPSVILAADCVYFEPAFPLLLQTMKDLIGPHTVCYFCFKKRRKADMRFIKDMVKFFHSELIEYDNAIADHREGVFLYKVSQKSRK